MKQRTSVILYLAVILLGISSISHADNGANIASEKSLFDRMKLTSDRDSFIRDNGDLPVLRIQISGNIKSKREIIEKETGILPGEKLSSFDPSAFINRLKKKNIYSEIRISYKRENDGAVIELYIKEKMTTVLIPMFYISSGSSTYGLYLFESNLFGYGKTVFTGGTYSNDEKSLSVGYIDPSLSGTRFMLNVFTFYKHGVVQDATSDRTVYREYRSMRILVRTDAGYGFPWGINFFLSGGSEKGEVESGYSGSYNMPESGRYYLAGARIKLDNLDYHEYFHYGPKWEIRYYYHFPAEGNVPYHTVDMKTDYSFRIADSHRLTLFSSASIGDRPAVLEERISGKTGTRTLPYAIISADDYINYSFIYEIPLIRLNFGIITLLTMWEQGVYRNDISDTTGYYGPGAGLLLYLKRVSFPAVGINYARNIKTAKNEFSANIGFSF